MNRGHQIEIVAGYYSYDDQFLRNENLSKEDYSVYQVKTNPAELIVDGRGRTMEACLYGAEHKLMAKDTYSVRNAAINLVLAVRQGTDGKEVSFLPDEIAILHQFAGENKRETLAMLHAVIRQIRDAQTREIVEQTADKIDRLSETAYAELSATTKRRFQMENERFIRRRLDRAKKEATE